MKNIDQKKIGKIWKENITTAEELAYCYYQSILDKYEKYLKKESKENFGFNAFADGIRLGLDVTLPMVDENTRKTIKEKINVMIKQRTAIELMQTIEENFREFEVAFHRMNKNSKNQKKKASS